MTKALGVATSVGTEADTAAATAAAAAVTQVAVTDALDGATFTGTALTTSATPTVDELEAIAGMLGLAVNAAGTDIAAQKVELDKLITDVGLLRTTLNSLLGKLRTVGYVDS